MGRCPDRLHGTGCCPVGGQVWEGVYGEGVHRGVVAVL